MTDATNGELRARIAELQRDVAVLQARLEAEAKARDIASAALDSWKSNSNEWQSTFRELTGGYVTREALDLRMRNIWLGALALLTVGIGLTTLLLKLVGG